MKKLFAIVLTLILTFSSFGITAPQKVSANTSLAGTYYISAKHSGKVLTVENGNSGTMITQQDKQDSDYQKWTVRAVSNEVYQIQNLASGLVLDVAQGVISDGAKIIQYENVGSTNQQWQFVGHADGSYEITSVCSGKNLDVEGASQENGANLIQWIGNGGENQKFVLENSVSINSTIESLPSVHEMTIEERKLFDELVAQEVLKYGQSAPELYKQTLTDFFDKSSGHAGDLNYATGMLGNDTLIYNINNRSWDWIPNIKVGVNFAGSAFNVAIGLMVGGVGMGAIKAFIISKGKKEAQRIFTRTVKSKLIEWGAPKLALAAGVVDFALEYADIGEKLAQYFDSLDTKPNNDWIDIYEF